MVSSDTKGCLNMQESVHRLIRRLAPLGVCFIFPWAMWAQTAAPNQTELIERLLQRVDQLEKRVAELESDHAVTVAAAATPRPEALVAPGPAPVPAASTQAAPG